MITPDIKVVDYHQEASVITRKTKTLFHIQVKDTKGHIYQIQKRFSDILNLHKELSYHKSLFSPLPPPPAKHTSTLVQSDDFLQKRMHELNVYFAELIRVDLITSHDGFLKFFSPSENT